MYMKHFNKKGFTLLEILVVVALIGIMAAIVVAALSSARNGGNDAAIQGNMANMRAQGELYYTTYGNYGSNSTEYSSTCSSTEVASSTAGLLSVSNPGLLQFTSEFVQKLGSENTLCVVAANGVSWAVAVVMPSSNTKVACVDNSGTTKISVTDLSSAISNGLCN